MKKMNDLFLYKLNIWIELHSEIIMYQLNIGQYKEWGKSDYSLICAKIYNAVKDIGISNNTFLEEKIKNTAPELTYRVNHAVKYLSAEYKREDDKRRRTFLYPFIKNDKKKIIEYLSKQESVYIGGCSLHPEDGLIWGVDNYGMDGVASNSNIDFNKALEWIAYQHERESHPAEMG